jgi:hypothetical protein
MNEYIKERYTKEELKEIKRIVAWAEAKAELIDLDGKSLIGESDRVDNEKEEE